MKVPWLLVASWVASFAVGGALAKPTGIKCEVVSGSLGAGSVMLMCEVKSK